MNDFAFATIQDLRKSLDSGLVSVPELISFYRNRFEQYDGRIESALEIFDADAILKQTSSKGALAGIPGIN